MSIRFLKNGKLHVLMLSDTLFSGEKIFTCHVWKQNGQAIYCFDVSASSFRQAKEKIIEGNFI